MIDGDVEWVLRRAARDGTQAALSGALWWIEPLLSWMVAGRARELVAEARKRVPNGSEETVLRVAALSAASALPAQWSSEQELEDALDKLSLAKPSSHYRAWWLSRLLVLLTASLAVGAWYFFYDPYAALHARLAPSPNAYTEGGRPLLGTSALKRLFQEELPLYAFLVGRGAGRATDADVLESGGALRAPEHFEALEPPLRQLVSTLERCTSVSRRGSFEADAAELRSVSNALNHALRQAKVAYYIDAYLEEDGNAGRHIYWKSFMVDEVRLYRAGKEAIDSYTLARIDDLGTAEHKLGFTRPDLREALVLRTTLEDHLVTGVLPALAAEGWFELADDDAERDSPEWLTTLRREVGPRLRQEWTTLSSAHGEALLRVGKALHERRQLFQRWNSSLAARNILVNAPRGYELEAEKLEKLRQSVTGFPRLLELRDELERQDSQLAFLFALSHATDSVAAHEVQHQLDHRAGRAQFVAEPVKAFYAEELRASESALHTSAELSAYTAELARTTTPRSTLLGLSKNLFNRYAWGSAESRVAAIVLERLAKLVLGSEIIIAGRGARQDAAALLIRLLDASDRLPAASKALWEEWFAAKLPELELASKRVR